MNSVTKTAASCKIEGCSGEAEATRGMYGGLCGVHLELKRVERQQSRNGHASVNGATVAHVTDPTTPPADDNFAERLFEEIVYDALATIDDVIAGAQAELNRKLRQEIAVRIDPPAKTST